VTPIETEDITMNVTVPTQRFLLGGEMVELWEDPEFPFSPVDEDIQEYVDRSQWVLLFNVLALAAPSGQAEAGC
jgi:hypothetical protein